MILIFMSLVDSRILDDKLPCFEYTAEIQDFMMAGYSPSVNIVLTNPSKVKDGYPSVAFRSATEFVEVLLIQVQSYRHKFTLFYPNMRLSQALA